MQPSPAEIARTLAAGHLPAVAHIACHPGPLPIRHVTDAQGRPLLLVPSESALSAALRPQPGNDDAALVLDIRDVPPMASSPSIGRVWVSGWAARLTGDEARAAALDYADTDACGDLLDVGGSQTLYRMDVAEVRFERSEHLIEIDPDDYAAASPDPLRAVEFDLIADLADHHLGEMGDYVRRQLGPAARPGDEPRVVRLDRYGFVVRLEGRSARLAFPRPVTDRHDLAHLLHPILCRRCAA
ncbi:hypothetical protein GCM10010168_80130 [Actinoplanes ianthinogenes]|uniref:DUF2470 domain-containing protein n=1 Tax=Actinoplanes ianthinogenes TaxID=122358 RepID=A0ABN6CKE8_9ACTN|nr:DUF2470 domain-containing protein [Actinoplanes ianthinogenes]BCJ45477.1 hypothetical protein Aiant_61340 [Actinoplanes ianthinogenes]GGR49313.1 hypothetical protein GCM10010168_80130 [Actinoplanes ianthinogenes]